MVTVRNPVVSRNVRRLLEESLRDDLIITNPLKEFLVKWNGNYSEKAARLIGKTLKTKQRQRSGSWSASSAGHCPRRQELQFLGMTPNGSNDAHLQLIFANGSWVHLRWQALLLTAKLLDGIEVLVKKPSMRARCSMDGMGVAVDGRYKGAEFGFELKGRNDFQYNKQVLVGVDDKTRAQVDFEFLLSGLDVFVILNENKNNQQTQEWVFYRDEDRVKTARAHLKELNAAIDKERLHPMLPECKKQLTTGEFASCPFGGKGGACVAAGNWPRRIK